MGSRKRSCQEVDRSSFHAANWRSRREKLDFYDFPFWMIHYQLMIEGGESGKVTEGGEEGGLTLVYVCVGPQCCIELNLPSDVKYLT